MAADGSQVTDEKQRKRATEMLLERHPGLRKLEPPNPAHSAVMRAYPSIVTILDYSKGFGHAHVLTVAPGGVEMTPARGDDWGFGSVLKRVSDHAAAITPGHAIAAWWRRARRRCCARRPSAAALGASPSSDILTEVLDRGDTLMQIMLDRQGAGVDVTEGSTENLR